MDKYVIYVCVYSILVYTLKHTYLYIVSLYTNQNEW